MISPAVLVQVKGWQRSFQPSMKARMAVVSWPTLSKDPRRIAWRVMIPKNTSTMFSLDGRTGGRDRNERRLGKHDMCRGTASAIHLLPCTRTCGGLMDKDAYTSAHGTDQDQ